MRRSIVRTLLVELANEGRHVVSDWRALVLLRRASRVPPPEEHYWKGPASLAEARALLDRMEAQEDLRRLEGLLGVYEVTAPYAGRGVAGDLEVLMEVHPCVAASHHTAFAFHGLTDDQPKSLHATVPQVGTGALPVGTLEEDWHDVPRAPARYPAAILGTPVQWHRVRAPRYIGVGEYRPEGWPVRVTTPERTLLDGLLDPHDCGGIGTVLSAWAQRRDLLDLDEIVALVDHLGVGVLRQRVGFIVETLGLSHGAFERWRALGRRGGSSRLHGGAPYAPVFDERWNLSLNVPVDVLRAEAA